MEAKSFRKKFKPFFKKGALEKYLVTFTRHLALLEERIEREIKENKGVCLFPDIKPIISTLILDILGENFYAFEFKSQEKQVEPRFIREIEISFQTTNKVVLQQWRSFFTLPILAEICLLLGDSLQETVQHVKSLTIFKFTMLKIIFSKVFQRIQRQSYDQAPGSFLDFFVNSRIIPNRWNPFALFKGISETLAHASLISFAAHDTTTSTFTWLLYFVATNESIREKVYAEVDSFSGEEEENSVASLASLKYIEAVIKETIRLAPVTPYLGRRAVDNLEITLPEAPSGEPSQRITLPRTANVIVMAQVIHSQERYFANASTFSPERFLEQESPERSQSPMMTASAYFPFSGGKRICTGNQYAMMQMKMILLCLCKGFNWTVDDDIQRKPLQHMLQEAARFPIKFTKRI